MTGRLWPKSLASSTTLLSAGRCPILAGQETRQDTQSRRDDGHGDCWRCELRKRPENTLERHVAPTELMGVPHGASASGFSSGVDFSAKLLSAPIGTFRRASASAKPVQHAAAEPATLTKAGLGELLVEHVGLNKRESKDMVEAFFAEISNALERGDSVKLTGFGNFQVRDKIPRPGRNPKTGVVANIPARRVVTFHGSQKLKAVANESRIPA